MGLTDQTRVRPVLEEHLDMSAHDFCNKGFRGSNAAYLVLQKKASQGLYETSVLQYHVERIGTQDSVAFGSGTVKHSPGYRYQNRGQSE